jgi:hypothetical protein
MNRYLVTIPIAGSISTEVDAENKRDAEDKAWEKLEEVDWDKMLTGSDDEAFDLDELETHRTLCEGNIFSGPCSGIEIDRIKRPDHCKG